jgi:hypothetical protein
MSRCKQFLGLIEAGKPGEAAQGVLKEMMLDPGYRGGLYVLGLAYRQMGLVDLAQGALGLYLELEPTGYWASHARSKLVEWNLNAVEEK